MKHMKIVGHHRTKEQKIALSKTRAERRYKREKGKHAAERMALFASLTRWVRRGRKKARA